MRNRPTIRSAPLLMSAATAVALIGFTPSGATAATHPNTQARPTAAAHSTGTQATQALPCGTVESESHYTLGSLKMAPTNIRNGPSTTCRVIAKSYKFGPMKYYCSAQGWTYLRDLNLGVAGWVVNDALSDGGSKAFCGFGAVHH